MNGAAPRRSARPQAVSRVGARSRAVGMVASVRPFVAFFSATSGMLFVATFDMPSRYYDLLRWVVCAAAVAIAVLCSRSVLALERARTAGELGDLDVQSRWGPVKRKLWWYAGLPATIAIAVLFNPVAPVYLYDKGAWRTIDIAVAVVMAAAAILISGPRAKSSTMALLNDGTTAIRVTGWVVAAVIYIGCLFFGRAISG